jgi:hypothetical protein
MAFNLISWWRARKPRTEIVVVEQFRAGLLAWARHLTDDVEPRKALKCQIEPVVKHHKKTCRSWSAHGKFDNAPMPVGVDQRKVLAIAMAE